MSKKIALLINNDRLVKYGEANSVMNAFIGEVTHDLENCAGIKYLEVTPDKKI